PPRGRARERRAARGPDRTARRAPADAPRPPRRGRALVPPRLCPARTRLAQEPVRARARDRAPAAARARAALSFLEARAEHAATAGAGRVLDRRRPRLRRLRYAALAAQRARLPRRRRAAARSGVACARARGARPDALRISRPARDAARARTTGRGVP